MDEEWGWTVMVMGVLVRVPVVVVGAPRLRAAEDPGEHAPPADGSEPGFPAGDWGQAMREGKDHRRARPARG